MQMHQRISLFVLAFTLAAANAALAAPEYRVTIVGPADSIPYDINKAGVVVGSYPVSATRTHAFLNRGTGLVDLGALGGTSSYAVAINDKGQVLGNWTTTSGQQRGFIYYHGTRRDIGAIPGYGTTYTDINNAGYITAWGSLPDADAGSSSFLRAPNGSFRNIGRLPFPDPTLTFANALNNRNQITGESGPLDHPEQPYRAFLWTAGHMRDLGDLGSTPNGGRAINDRGQVAGYASVLSGIHNEVAVIYWHGRVINIDGRSDTDPDRFSSGDAINNLGHVVGSSNHLSGFIYRGRRMESLNALIDPALGWDIRFPRAINDAGQIAAIAYRGDVRYAVRLDPIRPCLDAAPADDIDAEAGPIVRSGLTAEQEAADARAEAEAQAREVVKPTGR